MNSRKIIENIFFYTVVLFISMSFAENNLSFTSKIATSTIKFYQVYISPLNFISCRFNPSCSTYAMESIGNYGLGLGLLMTSDRLLRCNPFGDRGVDKPQDHYVFYKNPLNNFEYIDFFNEFLPEIENDNEVLNHAYDLFINCNYTEAIKQYNEFLSTCSEIYIKNNILYYIAFCYVKQKNYKGALEVLKSIREYDNKDLIRKNLFIGITYLSMNKNCSARNFFDKIFSLDIQENLLRKIHILKVWCFIKDNKWKDAKKELKKMKSYTKENLLIEELENQIEETKKFERKSTVLSGLLSSVIPGLGKVYSGRFYDGMFSFFFISSIGYLCYETYKQEAYVSFGVWSLYFVTFYSGNIYGSIDAAKKYNSNVDEKIEKIKFNIIKILKTEQIF